MRAAPLLAAWALLACTCLPAELPPWVLDYPITWGIASEVVKHGPYSAASPGIDVPDRTRADALPGDTIELRWYGAGPEDAVIDPPIWFARPETFSYRIEDLIRGEVSPCPVPLPQGHPTCRLGAGERVRVELAPTYDREQPSYFFAAIASDGAVLDPETCIHRALSEPDADLLGCLISHRTLDLGPIPRLALQVPIKLLPEEYAELTPDDLLALQSAPANTNPVIDAIELASPARSLHDGDHITTSPGAQIHLHLRLAPDAAGPVTTIYRGEIGTNPERLAIGARFSADIDAYEASNENLDHRFLAPGPGVTVTFFVQVDDLRGGRAFAALHFTASDEAP